MNADDSRAAQTTPAETKATLDDAAFLLEHFARSNAGHREGAAPAEEEARLSRADAFRDAAFHCRALLAGDPRSMRMLERLRREAAGETTSKPEMSTHAPHAWTPPCFFCGDPACQREALDRKMEETPRDAPGWPAANQAALAAAVACGAKKRVDWYLLACNVLALLHPNARAGETPGSTLRRLAFEQGVLIAEMDFAHKLLDALRVPRVLEGEHAPMAVDDRIKALLAQVHVIIAGDQIEQPTTLQRKILEAIAK